MLPSSTLLCGSVPSGDRLRTCHPGALDPNPHLVGGQAVLVLLGGLVVGLLALGRTGTVGVTLREVVGRRGTAVL